MKIKKGDTVLVIAGDDASRDKQREVLQVLDEGKKVLIKDVNTVFKHVRRGHPKSPQGGRLQMEMPIRSSNIVYYCNDCNQGTKLGLRYTDDGSKERFCRKCGSSAGVVSPPRAAHASK